MVILGLLTGQQLDRSRRVAAWGPSVATNWPLNDSAMSSSDLRDLGRNIRRNSDVEEIFATNDFCCYGSQWWSDIAADLNGHVEKSSEWWQSLEGSDWWRRLETEYGASRLHEAISDTFFGGDNYLLAAETRRRFLMQGLKWQALQQIPTPDQVNRMTLSLAFANDPDIEIVRELKRYGVSGFVVNLNLTDQRDWSQFAVEKFRSGNYVFLRLN